MMNNNPVYTMRLIDLLDMSEYPFNYDKIYDIVYNWLESEIEYFCSKDEVLFRRFIETFCDNFYSRNFNFDTTLDFKIKLRNVFRKYKDQAERVLESSMLNINPLITFENVRKYTNDDEESGKNSSKATYDTNSRNQSQSSTHNTNDLNSSTTEDARSYDLHSDTPSNSVNIDNMFDTGNNYITDAKNNKNHSSNTNKSNSKSEVINNTTDSNNVNTNNSNNSQYNVNKSSVYNEISNGFNGDRVELIQKYMKLTTDIVRFYIDIIESECLFSCVLY